MEEGTGSLLIKKAGAQVLGKEIIRKEMREPRFKSIWSLNPEYSVHIKKENFKYRKALCNIEIVKIMFCSGIIRTEHDFFFFDI